MPDSTLVQLKNALESQARRLTWSATLSGRPLRPLSASIDHGYDVVSSAATLVVREMPLGITEPRGQEVIIRAGYNGAQVVRFTGYLEDAKPGFWPGTWELRAAGRLRRTQYDYHDELTYADQDDETIVADLLTKAGIAAEYQDLDGEGQHFGVSQDVILPAGTPTWNLINELDQLTGYNTFDSPDGMVVRRELVHSPSASAAWAFQEKVNCFGGRRVKSRANVRNKIRVEGLPLIDGTEVVAVNQADSPYVPNPPQYLQYTLRSDKIEDDTYAATVAAREMLRRNKMTDDIEGLEAPGNPFLRPGMTVSVKGYELDLPSPGYYYVKHHHEEINEQGYISTLTLEGGIGDAGYQLLPPVAAFTIECDLETVDVSGTGTIYYAVACDASASYDPDNTPGGLTYSWSNNQTADVGTGITYTFMLTAAQLAAPCIVTLVVTDAEGLTGTLSREVVASATGTASRVMFLAAGSEARATQDGWQTYNVWAPGGGINVISTPEQAYEDASYFGLDDGKLYYTSDYLLSAPTLVQDFGSAVNSIWLHETQANRIVVGLANGEVWLSTDAGTTWTLLYTFGAAVTCVKESPMLLGQVWATSGAVQYVVYEGVATPATMATFPSGTARWTSNSFFGNYCCASVAPASGDAPVRGADDDSALTFPDMSPADQVEDVRGLTHHLYLDILWACDVAGRWFTKGEGETSFAYVATMPGSPGDVNHMLRDMTLVNLVYLACANGLYKTPDAGTTYYLLNDLTAAGLVGYQVGLGSLRLRVATGRRVYVKSMNASAVRVDRCDNIFAATLTWVTMDTGLPDGQYGGIITLDPTDPNTGYCRNEDGNIYRCDDMRGGGSWTLVLTRQILHDLSGYHFWFQDGNPTIDSGPFVAYDGTVYVSYSGQKWNSTWGAWGIAHSHDKGATWTLALLPDMGVYSYNGTGQPIWASKDGGRCWICARRGVGGALPSDVFYSDDSGHSWNQVMVSDPDRHYTIPENYNSQACSSFFIREPDAPNDNTVCLRLAHGTLRTVDGFQTYTWQTPRSNGAAWYALKAPDKPSLAAVAYPWMSGGYGGSSQLYQSTDGGATSTLAVDFGTGNNITEIYCVNSKCWLVVCLDNHLYTCTGDETLTQWVDRGYAPAYLWNETALCVDPEV